MEKEITNEGLGFSHVLEAVTHSSVPMLYTSHLSAYISLDDYRLGIGLSSSIYLLVHAKITRLVIPALSHQP